jgi:hypothetical protein
MREEKLFFHVWLAKIFSFFTSFFFEVVFWALAKNAHKGMTKKISKNISFKKL